MTLGPTLRSSYCTWEIRLGELATKIGRTSSCLLVVTCSEQLVLDLFPLMTTNITVSWPGMVYSMSTKRSNHSRQTAALTTPGWRRTWQRWEWSGWWKGEWVEVKLILRGLYLLCGGIYSSLSHLWLPSILTNTPVVLLDGEVKITPRLVWWMTVILYLTIWPIWLFQNRYTDVLCYDHTRVILQVNQNQECWVELLPNWCTLSVTFMSESVIDPYWLGYLLL